ncbi:MAG: hypothetical protein ACOC1I_03565 [Spirochaetota bacterium]
MRLQDRATRVMVDAQWEMPTNPLMGHPVLIVQDDSGGHPIPKALADQYVLVVATLEEMRIAVDHGFRFHEHDWHRPMEMRMETVQRARR